MLGEAIAVLTLVVTIITWLDELTWAKEHAAILNEWLLRKLCAQEKNTYTHNPCRNHRVQGPCSKV